MKKILQIFVFLICLLTVEIGWGQYIDDKLLKEYLGEINPDFLDLSPYFTGLFPSKIPMENVEKYDKFVYGHIFFDYDHSLRDVTSFYNGFKINDQNGFNRYPTRYYKTTYSPEGGAFFDYAKSEQVSVSITLRATITYNSPWGPQNRDYGTQSFSFYMEDFDMIRTNIEHDSYLDVFLITIPIHRPLETELKRGVNNNYLPINQKIKIYGRYITPNSINYQYRFAGESDEAWKDFSKKTYSSDRTIDGKLRSVLEVSASDIFGSEEEAKKHIGKKVQIRSASFKYKDKYISWSEPTPPLTITPSAPTLTQVTPALNCSYDKGVMKIKFSRKPYDGERLRLYIENSNANDANFPIDNVGADNDVTAALLASLSTTPELTVRDVSEGTYKIQLLGVYTYKDTNGQTQSISTYTSGPEHTYTVKVEAPKPLEALQSNVVTTPASCYGASDGSLSFSGVSGGTPPYSYQISKSDKTVVIPWTNFTQSNAFSVQRIPQGRYHIHLRDSRGCVVKYNNQEVEFIADVSGPSQALELTAISGHPNNYDKKGDVSLQVSGGTPPYKYEIREGSSVGNVQETGTFSASGTHRVGIDKLLSGQYYAKITDAKGCTSEKSFSIKAPLGIVSSSHTDIKCYGDSTGTIAFEVRGGTPPYRYENLQDGKGKVPFTGNTATITALKQGTYEIVVFDNEGKQAVHNGTPVTIAKTLSSPQRAIEITRNRSFSDYENTIEVTVIGGTPKADGSYDFEWRTENASGSVITSGITTALRGGFVIRLSNLAVGNYHLTVKDANRCTQTASYAILKPISITSFSSTDIKCYGAANGSFSLRVDGGKQPYSYRLRAAGTTEGSWQTFNGKELVRNDLSAGSYELEVRDADGNEASISGVKDVRRFSVAQPSAALQVSERFQAVSGSGRSDGSLSVEVKGGTPSASGYVVRLEDAQNRAISPLTNLFAAGVHRLEYAGLPAGHYRLRVTDANYAQSQETGCFVEKNIQITAPESLVVRLNVQKGISCHRQTPYNTSDRNGNGVIDSNEDGALQAQVQGGTSPYSYAWYRIEGTNRRSLGTNANVLSGLSAGRYLLEVTDKNNQKTSAEITLNEPTALQWQMGSDSSGCVGSAAGKAWINVQGGTPPYQYLWNNGATTARLENLASGTYTVEVTDANGCQLSGSVVVGTSSAIAITQETLTPPSCVNGSDGRISLTVQGGAGVYSVRWTDGATTLQRNNLTAGTYTVTITDGTPCGFLQKTFKVVAPEPIALNLPSELTLCQGDTRLFDILADDPQARYEWQRNGAVFSRESKVLIAEEGTYLAKITDSKGCEISKSMQVRLSNEKLEVNFLVTSYAFYDYAIRLVNVGDRLETWKWEIPKEAEVISESADHIDIKFPKEGTYRVGLSGAIGDCQKELYKTLLVEKDTFGEGLEDNKESNVRRFLVSPNPNDGNFRVLITLHNPEAVRLRIYDLQGKQMFPIVEKSSGIDFEIPYTSRLSAGQYLVVLEAGKEVKVEKMIVK